MAKPPSPLVGFNNNVKHLGRVFHVQTEDSGVSRPHVVTHLFADGGRIIKSTRTDYSEHLGRSDMGVVVRRLMKEQHKAMFIALRDGQLNEMIEGICGPAEGSDAPVESVRAPRKSRPAPTLPDIPLPLPPDSSLRAPGVPVIHGAADGTPIPRKAAPTLTELVLSDLGNARPRAATPEAPPPQGKPAPRGATPTLGTPAVSQRLVPGARSPSGRYAAPRPAPIFSNPPGENSLFGGSSISEQSLDEVILSYLAEDLDGASEK